MLGSNKRIRLIKRSKRLFQLNSETSDARVIPYDFSVHLSEAQLAGDSDLRAVIPVLPELTLRQQLRANALVLGALALLGVILLGFVLEHDATICASELSVL